MAVSLATSTPTSDKSALQVKIDQDQERALITYASQAQQLLTNQFSLRANLEEIDRTYMREKNWTEAEIRARVANRLGDAHKIQDVTVPIVMPQVESALAYMVNVFCTGYPIFGVAADPANEDVAMMIETIIAENAITAGWQRQMIMCLRDGLKYNLHALECEWQQKNVYTVETDIAHPNGAKPKTTLWKGNVLKRMDLYNTFFDPRVHPAEIHSEGEFAGYIDIMSRTRMKKYFNDLFGQISADTVKRALESSPAQAYSISSMAPFWYYQPLLNPYPTMDRNNLMGFDWLQWALDTKKTPAGIKYNNVYMKTRLYARIIPADFGFRVPAENTPQVWKIEIINGQVVTLLERQTNVHNFIPIVFGQPIEDGLDYQTKSFASNVSDMQDTASAMLSGYMASKRKMVGDRVIYDPLRIREKDINSKNPAAKIPLRPSGYGKPIAEAVYAFPYNDEPVNSLIPATQMIISYAERINRQNPTQQGQFVKGNKTLHEFQDTMGHSNDGNQLMALSTESQVFNNIKEIIKLNILQYQPPGEVQNQQTGQSVKIKPEDIRKSAVIFKVSDGELPEDKLMSTEGFAQALQGLAQIPGLSAGYNLPPLYSYVLKIQENVDLSPFEKSPLQQQYDQAVEQWQQVALAAVKAGSTPPAQPAMPPELIQELQQKQQSGGVLPPSKNTAALQSTQGGGS